MQGFNGDNLEAGIIDGQKVVRLANNGRDGHFYAVTKSGQRYKVDPEEFIVLQLAVQQ